MNRNSGKYFRTGYFKCLQIAVLAGTFLLWSEMPLLASPPQSAQPQPSQSQSGQSSAASQQQSDSLPDAPQPQSAQTQTEQTQAPSGAAGAKAANVKGAPAAQPAGAAVAPVRQHGHRSLMIKLGLLAGAGIAVGAVVALSAKSPTRPPGTSSPTQQMVSTMNR
jgi:cytoskeletal protein RodZ